MPKYCYWCAECGHQFEIIHMMSEVVTLCPECHSVDQLTKIPQIQNIKRASSVGKLVEDSIKENEEILKDQKKQRLEDL